MTFPHTKKIEHLTAGICHTEPLEALCSALQQVFDLKFFKLSTLFASIARLENSLLTPPFIS